MGKCVFCGGELRHGDSTTYAQTVDLVETAGQLIHIVVSGVPAEVCQKCGEKEYSSGVADKLFDFVKAAKKQAAATFAKGRLIYTYEGRFGDLPSIESTPRGGKAS